MTITRVINNEVVGKKLPTPANGVATVDLAKRSHLDQSMVRHSNQRRDKKTHELKGLSWWTCTMCKTRWTRHNLADAAQSTPQDTDLVTYGKYLGSTYEQLDQLEAARHYLARALRVKRQLAALARSPHSAL